MQNGSFFLLPKNHGVRTYANRVCSAQIVDRIAPLVVQVWAVWYGQAVGSKMCFCSTKTLGKGETPVASPAEKDRKPWPDPARKTKTAAPM